MQLVSKLNKGFRFLLCAIDIYGKYAWIIPLKDKKGITITNTFQPMKFISALGNCRRDCRRDHCNLPYMSEKKMRTCYFHSFTHYFSYKKQECNKIYNFRSIYP